MGGLPGYQEALAVLADPSHPEHADLKEWIGEEFDSQRFDRDAVNADLLEAFGPQPQAPRSQGVQD